MENTMADREGLIFKFFKAWKNRKLNKLATNLLNKDPQLRKDLQALGASFDELEKRLSKR